MSEPLRCLILATTGADGALIGEALQDAGLDPHRCDDVRSLCLEIAAGAGAVVIAAEALAGGALAEISATIEPDPVWSVLPIVLLSSAETPPDLNAAVDDLFGPRASVTVVERPCRVATLTSAVRSAIHTRRHQYEIDTLMRRLAVQSEDLARSNADLQRFAYVASHDLQEPLRSLTSYLTLIERRNADRLDERSREHFRSVVDSAARMRGLIQALLEYCNVGGARLNPSRFPSDAAIGEVINNLGALIQDADAVVRIGDLPTIEADRTLVVQLFQNLVSNAIKYRSGAPRIEISAMEDGDNWIFTVADNGIGISAENLDLIFEAFQRLHSRSSFAGYGIGLATCKRIVDLHRGRIWLTSTPRVGSRFFVSLPKRGPG